MLIIKFKYITLLKVFLCLFLILILYTVLVIYKLTIYNEKLQKEYVQKNLEGKTIQEFVKNFGKPVSIEYITPFQYNMTTFEPTLSESHAYFKLTYYTDNSFLNFISWFPCGGTKVFADKNNKLTGVRQYCY